MTELIANMVARAAASEATGFVFFRHEGDRVEVEFSVLTTTASRFNPQKLTRMMREGIGNQLSLEADLLGVSGKVALVPSAEPSWIGLLLRAGQVFCAQAKALLLRVGGLAERVERLEPSDGGAGRKPPEADLG